QGAYRRSASLDHHHRVHEVASRQGPDQCLLLDVNREGFFIVAVDDGGYAAFATQMAGGSLASPITRLGRQRKLFAHCMSPLCGFKHSVHASRDDHERGGAPIGEGLRGRKLPPHRADGEGNHQFWWWRGNWRGLVFNPSTPFHGVPLARRSTHRHVCAPTLCCV